MKTIKRNLPNLPETSDIKNYDKYFNHLAFKGIVHGQDIYSLDQQSFAEAKNVYVDEGSLLSRPTLQEDESLPLWVTAEGHELVEILEFENINIYVTTYREVLLGVDVGEYYRIAIDEDYAIDGIRKYKLATINHYIVAFNNLGAKVFDINNQEIGWTNLSEFVDIPITKRVVGNVETTYPSNEFTSSYKEQYIWSNTFQPILPKDETAEVEVQTLAKKYTLTIPKTDKLTDYRILRPVNFKLTDDAIVSVAHNSKNNIDIICIAYSDYFYVSYNLGESFTRVMYPVHDTFCNVASISDDGRAFFFVALDGVYRIFVDEITSPQWERIPLSSEYSYEGNERKFPIGSTGICNCCHFVNSTIFAFALSMPSDPINVDIEGDETIRVYMFGPGLNKPDYNLKTYEEGYIQEWRTLPPIADRYGIGWRTYNLTIEAEYLRNAVRIYYDNSTNKCSIAFTWPTYISNSSRLWVGVNDNNTFNDRYLDIPIIAARMITEVKLTTEQFYIPTDTMTKIYQAYYRISMFALYKTKWQTLTILFGKKIDGDLYEIRIFNELDIPVQGGYFLFKLQGGYIRAENVLVNTSITGITQGVYNDTATITALIPKEVIDSGNYKYQTFISLDKFYIVRGNIIWTNNLTNNDTATLTYTYLSEEDKFEDVPNVTYSDTELYMAFENKLRITQNTYDKDKMLFNLPKINDQSFVSPINAMLNISTTEVALFFRNKIILASKVEDETFGYRYDYNNTRLSVGVRLGDSVINTLEGQYTVFSTRRGLAFMSYQEFMATTDQTLEYVSDSIRDLWTKFYDASELIKIIQWRDYLVLTNGTNEILLLYLTSSNMSWWHWELPVEVKSMLTNQVDLKLIADTLCVFKDDQRYWDFPRTYKESRIDWVIQSQPLHMEAPNFYKSIRQLIFQLVETTKEPVTIAAQVKLYRKRLIIRDPEIVAFKIEELRTFVKRFNYWKVNEIQWGLGDDSETVTPAQLKLNGVSVKYEFGDEVK